MIPVLNRGHDSNICFVAEYVIGRQSLDDYQAIHSELGAWSRNRPFLGKLSLRWRLPALARPNED